MTASHPLWATDHASQHLGMVLEHAGPGAARLSLRVLPSMLNGHGTCHGGIIFTLADSAFAFACNDGAQPAVAAQCSISFLRPVREGEHLIATAEQRHREGRAGIFDVRVTSGPTIVAEFRGHSRTAQPPHAP